MFCKVLTVVMEAPNVSHHDRSTVRRLAMSPSQPVLDRGREARRVATASAVGTTIEWYDFFIYGTAAALVFGKQFFPQVSPVVGTLAAFATFAIGFLARPLGGVVMGHFGDRIGRKSMLVWSLMLMGIATFAIGLLPTYAAIGLWAPLLLVVLRFVQGFGLGGEWGGAALMAVEHAEEGHRGFFGSFVAFGLPIGIVVSNLMFLVVSMVIAPVQFAAWGWRVPFLLSAVLVAVGLFVRLRVAESPVFDEVRKTRAERRMPVLDVIRRDGRAVLLAAGSYLGLSALGYIAIVYFVSYATTTLQLPLRPILLLIVVGSVLQALAILVSGRLSDRLGRRRVLLWACAGLVVSAVLFFPLVNTQSFGLIAVALFVLFGFQGLYLGPQPAAFAELFRTSVRYSGASLSLQLGTILGGALVPFVATALYGATGNSWSVTIYVTALSVISLLCVFGLKETYQRDLADETAPLGHTGVIPSPQAATAEAS